MQKTLISFADVPQLSRHDVAYNSLDAAMQPFIKYPNAHTDFGTIIADKAKDTNHRQVLHEVFTDQYARLSPQAKVQNNLDMLQYSTTFTVTTAHQPYLFLGPAYVIYKTISTILLAQQIEKEHPGTKVVPVFVIGSEDHDFEEMNHIQLFGKRLTWDDAPHKGSVGTMPTASMHHLLPQLKEMLGESAHAQDIFAKVEAAYTQNDLIMDAVQQLLHELFGKYGLLVLNMQDARLKKLFSIVIAKELLDQRAFTIVSETIRQLQAQGIKPQAPPREINLFYQIYGMRERIVPTEQGFETANKQLQWNTEEMLQELFDHPEHFSPNVLLRPLFQELVLPNLAYVGGGGEIAYWMERKALFEYYRINFPLLYRRHSVLWLDAAASSRLQKLGITSSQLFADTDALIRQYVQMQQSDNEALSLTLESQQMEELFRSIEAKTKQIDATLQGSVQAELTKETKWLEQLEAKLQRAEKQKHDTAVQQIRTLKERFFPGNGLQERTENFMSFYLRHGAAYLDILMDTLSDTDNKAFVVLEEEK